MTNLFLMIVEMGMTAVPVIFAVFLIRFFLRHVPKRYSYVLWALVGFRLVCPVSFSSVFSIFNLKFLADTGIGSNAISTGYVSALSDQAAAPSLLYARLSQTPIAQALTESPRVFSTANVSLLLSVLTAIWLLGSLLCLGYLVISWCSIRKRVSHSVLLRDNIYECENIPSPFVMGIFHPMIYIPFHLEASRREMILLHEQCHIKRRDYLVKIFAWLLISVYWFHPLVWAAYFSMQKDLEMSCDEWVISQLGADKKKSYSTALLEFAIASSDSLPSGTILGFGEKGVRGRIQNILHFKKPGTLAAFGLAALCLAAMVFLCTNRQNILPHTENPSTAQETDSPASDIARELFSLKNPYVGDAPANSKLLSALIEYGCMPSLSYSMELETDQEPYTMRILFSEPPENQDTAEWQMMNSGNILLALITNLSKVEFQFPSADASGEPISTTLYWDMDAANASLNGTDIKTFGESASKLQELLT